MHHLGQRHELAAAGRATRPGRPPCAWPPWPAARTLDRLGGHQATLLVAGPRRAPARRRPPPRPGRARASPRSRVGGRPGQPRRQAASTISPTTSSPSPMTKASTKSARGSGLKAQWPPATTSGSGPGAAGGPHRHARQVHQVQHVGVDELGREVEGQHVEGAGRQVPLHREQGDARRPAWPPPCPPTGRRRARPGRPPGRSGSRRGSGGPGWAGRSRRCPGRPGARPPAPARAPAPGRPARRRCSGPASGRPPAAARSVATASPSPGSLRPPDQGGMSSLGRRSSCHASGQQRSEWAARRTPSLRHLHAPGHLVHAARRRIVRMIDGWPTDRGSARCLVTHRTHVASPRPRGRHRGGVRLAASLAGKGGSASGLITPGRT